jgi:hypothetical protein
LSRNGHHPFEFDLRPQSIRRYAHLKVNPERTTCIRLRATDRLGGLTDGRRNSIAPASLTPIKRENRFESYKRTKYRTLEDP